MFEDGQDLVGPEHAVDGRDDRAMYLFELVTAAICILATLLLTLAR